jgi:hypothetical protein
VAVEVALRGVVVRAAVRRLAARVGAAFLALVERLVAFVLRVVAAFWAGVAVVVVLVVAVVSAMSVGLLVGALRLLVLILFSAVYYPNVCL